MPARDPLEHATEAAGTVTLTRRLEPLRRRTSLLLYHRDGAELVALQPGEALVIGRGEEADVVIDDPALSRRHARFSLGKDDAVVVEDLASTNGIWVDGRRVERAELAANSEVVLGALLASLHVLPWGDAQRRDLLRHEPFAQHLQAEVRRARFFGRPLALALLAAHPDEPQPVRNWLPSIVPLLRPVDRIALYSPAIVEVLMPELTSEAALEAARAFAHAATPSLACGLSALPSGASSADELIEQAREALRRAAPRASVQVATPAVQVVAGGAAPVTASPAMQRVFAMAKRAAASAIPVLITGETGSGKDVVARFMHAESSRAQNAMVSVNCAAIPEQLVESTLFGHERGAFTGATQARKGLFEAADGGTVFLDELGDLPLDAQAKLLRVLETKSLRRVGAATDRPVDLRLVAATHRDLAAMVEAGSFREDLLFRLNAMTLEVPPLRERREDIPALAERFLREEAGERTIDGIEPDALEALVAYRWPGNVRELRNVIARAVVVTERTTIGVEDLPSTLTVPPERSPAEGDLSRSSVASGTPATEADVVTPSLRPGEDLRAVVDRFETSIIVGVLRETDWNRVRAAGRLGIPVRTLAYRCKVLGIRRPS